MRFNKIFCIGLPRTGTTSLNLALKKLGVNSIHFPFEIYDKNDFSVLKKYEAFVDTPIPLLYKKLDHMFPNSAFILTTRPCDGWLKSMTWLLKEGPKIWQWKKSFNDYNKELFGSEDFNYDFYKAKFKNFHKEVKEYFKGKNNLLILDIGEGYGYKEICKFLGIPEFKGVYPKGNVSRKPSFMKSIAYYSGKLSPVLERMIRQLENKIR